MQWITIHIFVYIHWNFYRDCSDFYIYIYIAWTFDVLIRYFPKGSSNFHPPLAIHKNPFFASISALNIITFWLLWGEKAELWGHYFLFVYIWLKINRNFLNIIKWFFFFWKSFLTKEKISWFKQSFIFHVLIGEDNLVFLFRKWGIYFSLFCCLGWN